MAENQVRAVLFDRDGTLVEDVPYNADPDRVRPMPGAHEALDLLRLHGIRTGVISNQPGVGRGLLTLEQVRLVNARIEALLGRFSTWQICPHRPGDGCDCRKPRPGLINRACAKLGVRPAEAVVIGDGIGDLRIAAAAGSPAVLVPGPATPRAEVDAAPVVAENLLAAVRLALSVPAQETR
jgi:D-glycero-D-manno-heptose 1,7-bisphosphate phosphatase